MKDICSICLDAIENDDVLGVSHTHCGHVFHTVCLQRHMGQAVIDAKVDDCQCLITEDHHGFHCPNCRERLETNHSMGTKGFWYSSPPSQVAFDALLVMYNQRHKTKRRDEQFKFVHTTAETARRNSQFATVLETQREAQRNFSCVNRMNDVEVYRAYTCLSITTAQMLEFYLQYSGWSKEHYKPLLESQLQKYGLDTRVLRTLS